MWSANILVVSSKLLRSTDYCIDIRVIREKYIPHLVFLLRRNLNILIFRLLLCYF